MLPISDIPACLELFTEQFAGVFNHPAQKKHCAEYLAGLMTAGNRTIAGIHQSMVGGSDYDSLHHFMSSSPWSSEAFREERLKWVKKELPIVPKSGTTVVAIDSTFVHHTGEKIFGVYWYYDYVKKCFCLAQRVVLSTLVTPSHLVPLGYEMFHRGFLEEQKLFLEETKPAADASQEAWQEFEALVKIKEEREKAHKTQLQLAADLVDECEAQGIQKDAYVLDGAFLDKTLMGRIDEYGQAWVTRLAKSRRVQVATGGFESIGEFAKSLPKESFTKARVTTRHGEERTYWTFGKNMMVMGFAKKLRILISYDNEKLDGEPYFLISNKTSWIQAHKILQTYTYRDPIEHLIRDEKQEFGFEDNQQRKETAVLKHWELAFAAHAFTELSFKPTYPEGVAKQALETSGQKCRLFEIELLQGFINHVKAALLENWDTKELLSTLTSRRLNRLAC